MAKETAAERIERLVEDPRWQRQVEESVAWFEAGNEGYTLADMGLEEKQAHGSDKHDDAGRDR